VTLLGISSYFPFKCILLGYIPLFVVTFCMPPKKKVIGILIGVGENHQSKPSKDHISMLFEGTKSSYEAGHHESMSIMAAIEDL